MTLCGEVLTTLANEAKTILSERGCTWGSFGDFVQKSSVIKDDFRMFYKNIDDIKKIEFYRLRNFIEEMLVLKLTRGAYTAAQLQCLDYKNKYFRDCAIDFLNYCELCSTQFKFDLHFQTIHADKDWLLFFDKTIRLIAFGEQNDEKD